MGVEDMVINATVNFDVEEKDLAEAAEILDSVGLSVGEAVNLMLQKVKTAQGLPFDTYTADEFYYTPKPETLALIESIENGTADMAGPFKTMEEFRAWLAEDDDDDTDI